MADFQQFYALDATDIGGSLDASRAATLASQLPKNSRCSKSISGHEQWGDSEMLLSLIEYELRILIWQKSKKAQGGSRFEDKPFTSEDFNTTKRDESEKWRFLVDSRLGMKKEEEEVVNDG